MLRLLVLLLSTFTFLSGCYPDKDKRYKKNEPVLRSLSNSESNSTSVQKREPPDYEKIKASLILPPDTTDYYYDYDFDTMYRQHYVSMMFLQKDKEIEANRIKYKGYGIPDSAKIIEVVDLAKAGVKDRRIAYWMTDVSATIHMDDDYSCPTVTTGMGYYSGKIRFSLLDTKLKRIINTIEVQGYQIFKGHEGFFELPFSIRNPDITDELAGLKYHATGGTDSTDGKAVILYLDDYNGDGDKLEFALYDQMSCMLASSILYGYSKKQDKVVNYLTQYQVYETIYDNEQPMHDTSYNKTDTWVGHNYVYKADKNGNIVYTIDYRGRGGELVYDSVHYNSEKECFEGVLDMRHRADDNTTHIPYFAPPQRLK